MRDLLREGLKLGEAMARLPWEAARRMAKGRSETMQRAADLGERLGTLPFRAAHRVVGSQSSQATSPNDSGTATGRDRYTARIVVLGAGYAGLTCFLELQHYLGDEYDLILVNGDKFHWFTTEFHTYVAGEKEDAVRIPLARVVAPPGRLVVGRVVRLYPEQHAVELADGDRIPYDYLIFALGSDPEYYGLPGVAENSLIIGNWEGATRLRERVTHLVSADEGPPEQTPHVVVAGGGLTGVEVAGELVDEYGQKVRLTIVEAGPEIMAGFAPELVQTARGVLEAKGVAIRTGNPIARVEPGMIHFKDGSTLPFTLLVWAGGVRGSRVLGNAGLAITPRGRGKVDAYLHAEGHRDVYLLGDSAAFVDPVTGRELPPTAQAAVQMGHTAGRNVIRQLRGQAELPFEPKLKGAFASLGRKQGVGQLGKEQFSGMSAMMIKHLIEAHHAWETGGGVMPLVTRLLRAPQRLLGSRSEAPHQ